MRLNLQRLEALGAVLFNIHMAFQYENSYFQCRLLEYKFGLFSVLLSLLSGLLSFTRSLYSAFKHRIVNLVAPSNIIYEMKIIVANYLIIIKCSFQYPFSSFPFSCRQLPALVHCITMEWNGPESEGKKGTTREKKKIDSSQVDNKCYSLHRTKNFVIIYSWNIFNWLRAINF